MDDLQSLAWRNSNNLHAESALQIADVTTAQPIGDHSDDNWTATNDPILGNPQLQ